MTVFSKHAKQRWQERFPLLNMEEEFYKTNETLIRKGSIVRKTKDGIFFILAKNENSASNVEFVVMTVYDSQKRWSSNKKTRRARFYRERRAMQTL